MLPRSKLHPLRMWDGADARCLDSPRLTHHGHTVHPVLIMQMQKGEERWMGT